LILLRHYAIDAAMILRHYDYFRHFDSHYDTLLILMLLPLILLPLIHIIAID
jgi:hypothetical protein